MKRKPLAIAVTTVATGALVLAGCTTSDSTSRQAVENQIAPAANSMSLTGGGFRAHSGHAALVIGILQSSGQNLSGSLNNVANISSNSGGTWFLNQLAYSPTFDNAIEQGDALQDWDTTGYMGQVQKVYSASESTGCSKLFDPLCQEFNQFSPYLTLATVAGGPNASWQDVVHNLVFEPYSMNKELSGTTIGDTKQEWAQNKTLVNGTSVLNNLAILSDRNLEDFDNKTFYNTQAEPSGTTTTPFGIVAPAGAASGTSGFLTGPMNLQYGPNADSPTEGLVSQSEPAAIDVSGMNVVDAATVSSAAAGAAASSWIIGLAKKAADSDILDVLNNDEYAYDLSNLAPGYSLDGMTYVGPDISDTKTAQDLAGEQIVRFADGGYGDTSVGHMLRQLQNSSDDGFNIFVVAQTEGTAVSGDFGGYGSDIAQLFGYQTANGITNECVDKLCIPTTQAQVFDPAALGSETNAWTYSDQGIDLRYGSYQVTTVANPALGIEGGTTGTLNVFQSLSDVGDVPTDGTTFADYQTLMEVIVSGVTDNGGWQYVKQAIGSN